MTGIGQQYFSVELNGFYGKHLSCAANQPGKLSRVIAEVGTYINHCLARANEVSYKIVNRISRVILQPLASEAEQEYSGSEAEVSLPAQQLNEDGFQFFHYLLIDLRVCNACCNSLSVGCSVS